MLCISYDEVNGNLFGGFGLAAALAIRWAFAAIHANARLAGAFGLLVQRHPAGALFFFGHGFEIKVYDAK